MLFRFVQRFLLLVLIFTVSVTSGSAEIVSKVAAVVNDSVITTYQLEKAFEETLALNPAAENLDSAEKEKLRLQVLDTLIEEELIKERVKQLRLSVSDADVDAAVADVQRQNKLTLEQLKSALQQQGMEFEVYRENLRKQILRFKLIGVEVQSKAEVTSAEVREYYREHAADYRDEPYMHLSHLSFPVPKNADEATIDEIRELAVQAQKRLKAGESIDVLLISYATAKVDGGDMGKFKLGELTGIFDRAVRNLDTGDASEVVEMPNAFYLFKMLEKSGAQEKPFDTVSGEIEQTLLEQKREQAFKDWSEGLRKNAYIDIRI